MASPVAHSLIGLSAYVLVKHRHLDGRLLLAWLVLAANLPDLDFIPGLLLGNVDEIHHSASHSLGFAVLVALLVAVFLYLKDHGQRLQLTLLSAGLVSSHLLVDWLTRDRGAPYGIPLLWPLTSDRFQSPTTIFLDIRRNNFFTWEIISHDLRAVAIELLLCVPLLLACLYVARRMRGGKNYRA